MTAKRTSRSGEASEGNWYILQSNGSVFRGESFGLAGDDPTVVGDYNGDGNDDMAVYRPGAGNTQSNFYYRTTAGGGIFTVPFGLGDDKAVGGDFDGDGTADFHVARRGRRNLHPFRTAFDGRL